MSLALGLTGKYCSGKNLAARELEEMGFLVLDADRMGHEALETERLRVEGRFGPGLLKPDGSLDRKELGRRVFGKREELAALEAIIHPIVIARIEAELDAPAAQRICVNAALLYRTSLTERCDFILEIRAPFLLRMRRGMKRDGIRLMDFINRMLRQRKLQPGKNVGRGKIRVIHNFGSAEELIAAIRGELASLPIKGTQ